VYEGQHQPLISRDLFERVQRVFVAANHPPHGTKRQHSFVGLLKCARCGCSFTTELKKGQYVYHHCTGAKGPCGNTYIREEDLAILLGEVVKQVRIPTELADAVAKVLRESDRCRSGHLCAPIGRNVRRGSLYIGLLDAA